MAVTLKELLNRALKITTSDTIDTGANILSGDVEIMLGEVANELKEEIEDAHNWRALRQEVTISLSASENSKTITEAYPRTALRGVGTARLRHDGRQFPLSFARTGFVRTPAPQDHGPQYDC
jgi:hypothetical protein